MHLTRMGRGGDGEDEEASAQGEEVETQDPKPKKARTEHASQKEHSSDDQPVRDEAKTLGYAAKLITALKAANGSVVQAKKMLSAVEEAIERIWAVLHQDEEVITQT